MNSGSGSSRGQVLIIFVFAIIGLIAIVGLAIDGGNIYADRRQAQNAADTAALAGGLARANWMAANPGSTDCFDFHTAPAASKKLPQFCDAVTKALNAAETNGFNANGGAITVDVYSPPIDGYYATCSNGDCDPNDYIEVVVHHDVNTWFARVVGIAQTHTAAEAVALSVATHKDSPFPDAAIVALDPRTPDCGFDNSGSGTWVLKGAGIFSNSKACNQKKANITWGTGNKCVTSVGTTDGSKFNCTPVTSGAQAIKYPDDVTAMLPPKPACDVNARLGSDGKVHEAAGGAGRGSKIDKLDGSLGYEYAPGLYCVTGTDNNIHHTVKGTGVTFYIMRSDYYTKYNGGGSLAISAPTGNPSNPYNGVLMFSDKTVPKTTPAPNVCNNSFPGQTIDIRGNGSTPITGTIFMPGACIDWRGNGTGTADDAQIIAYSVTNGGDGSPSIEFHANDKYQITYPGQVGLLH